MYYTIPIACSVLTIYRMPGNIGGNNIWWIRHFPNLLILAADRGTAMLAWAGSGTAAAAYI